MVGCGEKTNILNSTRGIIYQPSLDTQLNRKVRKNELYPSSCSYGFDIYDTRDYCQRTSRSRTLDQKIHDQRTRRALQWNLA